MRKITDNIWNNISSFSANDTENIYSYKVKFAPLRNLIFIAIVIVLCYFDIYSIAFVLFCLVINNVFSSKTVLFIKNENIWKVYYKKNKFGICVKKVTYFFENEIEIQSVLKRQDFDSYASLIYIKDVEKRTLLSNLEISESFLHKIDDFMKNRTDFKICYESYEDDFKGNFLNNKWW